MYDSIAWYKRGMIVYFLFPSWRLKTLDCTCQALLKESCQAPSRNYKVYNWISVGFFLLNRWMCMHIVSRYQCWCIEQQHIGDVDVQDIDALVLEFHVICRFITITSWLHQRRGKRKRFLVWCGGTYNACDIIISVSNLWCIRRRLKHAIWNRLEKVCNGVNKTVRLKIMPVGPWSQRKCGIHERSPNYVQMQHFNAGTCHRKN